MSQGQFVGRFLVIALAGLLTGNHVALSAATDPPGMKEVSPLLIPGGVADAEGKIAYVANPQAGMDVLQLETGKLLWTTAHVRQPLIVAGGRVIAEIPVKDQPKQIVLAAFDAGQAGGRVVQSEPLTFPDWVSVESELSHSFGTRCRVVGNTLILTWRADAWYGGGTNISVTLQAAERKAASGEVRLDLTTGKTAAKLHDIPVELTGPGEPRDITLGRYRLLLGETAQAGAGFSRNIKRKLRATDAKSGKLLWEHNLAPEAVIPAPK